MAYCSVTAEFLVLSALTLLLGDMDGKEASVIP